MVETQLCNLRDTSDTLIGRAMYYIVLFQDLTIRSTSGLPTVRGTAGIQQYIARKVFHSSMLQYFHVRYYGHTLSPRGNWPSVQLLTYSQYSQYFGRQDYSNTLSTRSTK